MSFLYKHPACNLACNLVSSCIQAMSVCLEARGPQSLSTLPLMGSLTGPHELLACDPQRLPTQHCTEGCSHTKCSHGYLGSEMQTLYSLAISLVSVSAGNTPWHPSTLLSPHCLVSPTTCSLQNHVATKFAGAGFLLSQVSPGQLGTFSIRHFTMALK